MGKQRYHNIDFIRFLCCAAILILHAPLCQLDVPSGIGRSALGVEFFFILSGIFLYFSFSKQGSISKFVIMRWIRLMPVVIASFIAVIALHRSGLIVQETQFKDVFMSLFFVRNIALFNDAVQIRYFYDNSHLWFIGPLFWSSLFYWVLFRSNLSHTVKFLVTAVLVYWGYLVYINLLRVPAPGLYGLWRGISGIGMGVILGMIVQHLSIQACFAKPGWRRCVLFSALEIFLFYLLIDVLFIHTLSTKFYFYGIVEFALVCILFYLQQGYLSRFLNLPFLGLLGKWSYSIYVFQYVTQIMITKGNKIGNMTSYLEWKAQNPILAFVLLGVILPIITGGGYTI